MYLAMVDDETPSCGRRWLMNNLVAFCPVLRGSVAYTYSPGNELGIEVNFVRPEAKQLSKALFSEFSLA